MIITKNTKIKTKIRRMKDNDLRTKIKETTHFKELSKIVKDITLNTNNVRAIDDALIQINNIGFKRWSEISNFRYNNALIIKEIVQKTHSKNQKLI